MSGARRRWQLLLGVVVVVASGVGTAWVTMLPSHGDPDPGGRILASLRTVESAIPADADVMLHQAIEPRWDSCDGRAGTFGWDDVTVSVQFGTSERPDALVAQIDRILARAGWHRADIQGTPLGPSERWSRELAGAATATAVLSPGTRGGGGGIHWDLDAAAPPQGQPVSGC